MPSRAAVDEALHTLHTALALAPARRLNPGAQGRRGERQGVMLSTISLQLGSTERCEVCSGR